MLDKQSQIDAGDKSQNVLATGDNAEVHIGISFEQYKCDLEAKEQKIEALMFKLGELTGQSNSDKIRHQELTTQLAAVQTKLQNVESSYQQDIQQLQEQIKRLQTLKGQLPDKLIAAAQQALQNGDSQQADQLFEQIQVQAESPIQVAAEASFQRAQIAKQNIDYHQALKHYQRAAQLAPDNSLYLNDYGLMLSTMGQLDKAIEYYQQALAIAIKSHGEDHPRVAAGRNNLGLA